MASLVFHHPNASVGDLTIENGIDNVQWAYGLNTATFPTYGGEVVQILSVYIDDLTMQGTVATYSQMEAIYSYFSRYMQIATQGSNPHPAAGQSAYNMQPVTMTYATRGWTFDLIPKEAPGFRYSRDIVTPTWQLIAHVVDDSLNLDPIKNAIKDSVVAGEMAEFAKLNGEISPNSGNPEINPFQTYNLGAQQGAASLQKYADYFNSLIPAYNNGDFSAITGGLGSAPSFGQNAKNKNQVQSSSPGQVNAGSGSSGTGGTSTQPSNSQTGSTSPSASQVNAATGAGG